MAEAGELTGSEGMKKIGELIADIRFAMLTTVAADGTLDSRPMATQKTEFDGVLWFLTRGPAGKRKKSPRMQMCLSFMPIPETPVTSR